MNGDDVVLGHIRDLEALRSLGQRYARAIDARDLTAVAECFARDAVIDGVRGSSSITEYLTTLGATPPAYAASMHVLGDPLVELAPGGDLASLDTYAVVYQIAAGDGHNSTLGIRYLDAVERVDGVWRIRHRRTELVFMA